MGASAAVLSLGCTVRIEQSSTPSSPPTGVKTPSPDRASVFLPKAELRFCTAVVILLDTSGSMLQEASTSGGRQPKHVIARRALERIIDSTAEWQKAQSDRQLELGILQFSSDVSILLDMGPFDGDRARACLGKIHPSSGTAIGRALEMGFKVLYASGCARKHILCITDGDNTSGPSPERIAKAYHEATEGAVAIHFIAFDTEAKKFRFLEQVNGRVVGASDGEQLQTQLTEIYEKRILAEAMPEGND